MGVRIPPVVPILEDAVRWFLHLFGKQATGASWSGFDSSFFRQWKVIRAGLGTASKAEGLHRGCSSILPPSSKQCPYGQIGKVVSLKRRSSLRSNRSRGTSLRMHSATFLTLSQTASPVRFRLVV